MNGFSLGFGIFALLVAAFCYYVYIVTDSKFQLILVGINVFLGILNVWRAFI